jgi:hypothetical protein
MTSHKVKEDYQNGSYDSISNLLNKSLICLDEQKANVAGNRTTKRGMETCVSILVRITSKIVR